MHRDADEPSTTVDVQLHWIDLDAYAAHLHVLEPTLDPAEIERANRFRTPVLRRRFVAARGMLRRLLADRLDVAPRSVAFEYGAHGKPRLAPHESSLEFNVSHCEGVALIAISTVPVGVDVERLRTVADVERVAAHVFSADEMTALFAATDRDAAFVRGWTRKEAVLKAQGVGLSGTPRAFSVSLDDWSMTGGAGPEVSGLEGWVLRDVSRSPSYVAALATPSGVVSVVSVVSANEVGLGDIGRVR